MKIIKESKIEERFPNESTLDDHYGRHVKKDGYSVNRWGEKEPEFTPKKFPTKQDYDDAADKFARKPVTGGSYSNNKKKNGNIVGFIGKDKKHHKYDTNTGEFTAYYLDKQGNPVNMSYYLLKNNNRYDRDRKSNYYKDIDDEEHFK